MVNFHTRKKYKLLQSFFDQKSTTNPNKSYKIAKKRKKAPKGTQEQHKACGNHSCSDLGTVLGRSWGALGTPRAGPNAAKSTKIGARSEFDTFFLSVIFHITFRIDLLSIVHRFLTLSNLKKHAPVLAGARFSQSRRFRDEA